jgi:hypothetical protein
MNNQEKIVQVRQLLGIPDGLRIGQHLWNQFEAHDYTDFFYMPDDVFIAILQEKEDYAKMYRRIRKK